MPTQSGDSGRSNGSGRDGARELGYWAVVAIGVGGMVGGGIFAVLGLAVELAGSGTPVAFLLGGIIALLTSYSYAHLSVALPSQGGTVSFLNAAFGTGLLTGSLNVLLWLSYVIMLALYAHAFGSYAAALIPGTGGLTTHLLMSGIIVLVTALNLLSARIIGMAEEWIVAIKIVILLVFVAVGSAAISPGRLALANWASPFELFAGGMIIFVAYEGFELIANSAQDVPSPGDILPRAYYTAVGFVLSLYVAIAVVTVGGLAPATIQAARDYALAEAARPVMGGAGFTMIAVAAVLSTTSAINATLYGSARLSFIIAKEGELPQVLERKVWSRPVQGLLLTGALTLLVVNVLNLSSISNVGSVGFLLIFGAVNVANIRLRERTQSRWIIPAAGAFVCLLAVGALVWHAATTAPWKLLVIAGILALAVAIEGAYRLLGRRLAPFDWGPFDQAEDTSS